MAKDVFIQIPSVINQKGACVCMHYYLYKDAYTARDITTVCLLYICTSVYSHAYIVFLHLSPVCEVVEPGKAKYW